MKKLHTALHALLVAVLVGYVSYACISMGIIPAHANEEGAQGVDTWVDSDQEENPSVIAAAPEAVNETVITPEQSDELMSEEPKELIPEQSEEHNADETISPSQGDLLGEQPYWLKESEYSQLISEYDSAALAADGHTVILGATLSITSMGNGLQSAIHLGEAATVLSSGVNAPAYNDGNAILLTPQEGYPQPGTSSDRSMLRFVESGEGPDGESRRVYEATFFFGSSRFPEAPFTAFSTFVVLAGNETAGEEEDVATPATNEYTGEGKGTAGEDEGEEATAGESGEPGDPGYPGALPAEGATPPAEEEAQHEDTVPPVVNLPEGGYLDGDGTSHTPLVVAPLLPSDLIAPMASPSDYYVGYRFTSTVNGVTWWNGSIQQGVFGINFYVDGALVTGYVACLKPGWPGPMGPDYVNYVGHPVYCTVSSIDYAGGWVHFSVYVPPPYNGPYQDLSGINFSTKVNFSGSISLVKSSASPAITNGNNCYDLADAEYGLYRTWADATLDVNRVHTFITDSAGNGGTTGSIPCGDYVLKEIKAPKGYALDPNARLVSLNSTHITVTRTDVPLGDPMPMLVQKLDSQTGEAYGQDDPNGFLLAGAEFTVRYWDGYFDTIEEAEASGDPTRTWIVRTIENGRAALLGELLVEGSDQFYINSQGNPTIPLGSVSIQETKAPPGYLLPDPSPISFQQIRETGEPLAPVTRLNAVIVEEEPHVIIAEKVDSETNEPVPNTEFTLYKESAPGAGDWLEVSRHVTDDFGKCVFSPVAVGSYKLDETRANPAYAELEESGDSAHYFSITPESTEEVQVFRNDLIQVAIEVYKKTIPLTNTALDGTRDQAGNHVGNEEYLYNFGARSNSNVRVDEFVITDSLEFVTSQGYRMTTLWTGTAPVGMDYDGLMHILYQTNMTDPAEPVSFGYNPMSANPPNPNNPQNYMSVSVEPGWRVWKECVSTTTAERLEVADLGLAEGEYITGLRAVYGGVVKGFYTGTGWQDSEGSEVQPESTGATEEELGTFVPFELRDFYYSVVATDALLTIDEIGNETVMRGSIKADLFRNWGENEPVLTDIDHDEVETRVIETFSHDKQSLGITPGGFRGFFPRMPSTGDSLWITALIVAIVGGGGTILIAMARKKRRNTKAGDEEE